VAGLCIGVDEYAHIGNLSNAVRDADAVCSGLKAASNCYAEPMTSKAVTSTAGGLIRSVRKRLQEPGLLKDPPLLFVLHYAGHGIQTKEKKVYLVPGNARTDHPDDLERECLSLDTLMRTLRQELDEPVLQKFGEARAIVFLVVLDACRVPGPNRSFDGALACEPAPESAPLRYTIVFSCSRTTTASDGPSGEHSPFVRALLDAKHGIFAEGVSLHAAIANVSNALPQAQAPISMKLEALPQGFCIRPGSAGMGKRKQEVDVELWALLQERKLEDYAGHIAKHGGVTSLEELKEFEEKRVEKLELPLLQSQRFSKMLQHVKQQEKKKKGSAKKKQKNDPSSAAEAFRRQLDDLEAQGDVRAIVKGMQAYNDAEVQWKGCRALYNLAVNDDKQKAIAVAGGIPVVLAAMKAHEGHKDVQEQGCGALVNLAFNADNKMAIAAAGGIPVVLAAMKAHKGHVDVQYHGCWALANLAANADNKIAIAAAGGIPVVLAAMMAHKGHVQVQWQGCWALGSLAIDDDHKIAIAAAVGIPVVLGAMKAHKGDVDVQLQGCGALRNLAANADNKIAIAAAGGIPVVVAAMKAHKGDVDV